MSPVKKESTPYVPPPMSESGSGYEWLSGNVLSYPSTVMLNVSTVMVVEYSTVMSALYSKWY